MNRPTRIPPVRVPDLERWQKRSESKFPPWTPRPRLHELPDQAAPNAAAGTPTIDEEVPVDRPDGSRTPDDLEISHGKEIPRDPEEVLDEDAAIERARDGTTRAEDSGAETNPSAVG